MRAPPTAARGNIPYPRRFGEPSLGDWEVFGVAVSPIRTLCSGTCGHLARHAQPSILSRNQYSPSVRTGATPLHSQQSTAQPRCEYRPYGEMPPACRANTDPVGKRRGRLRPAPSLLGAQKTRIPTPWGNNNEPVGGVLPIPWGKLTDPWGVLYRAHRGRLPTSGGNSADKIPANGRFMLVPFRLHGVVFVFNVLSC